MGCGCVCGLGVGLIVCGLWGLVGAGAVAWVARSAPQQQEGVRWAGVVAGGVESCCGLCGPVGVGAACACCAGGVEGAAASRYEGVSRAVATLHPDTVLRIMSRRAKLRRAPTSGKLFSAGRIIKASWAVHDFLCPHKSRRAHGHATCRQVHVTDILAALAPVASAPVLPTCTTRQLTDMLAMAGCW